MAWLLKQLNDETVSPRLANGAKERGGTGARRETGRRTASDHLLDRKLTAAAAAGGGLGT
jgi:hypothetical protein